MAACGTFPLSKCAPDQSWENFSFKYIVGNADAKMAIAQTAIVASGRRKIIFSEGKMAIAHGNNSGRLLVFALVIIAAAKMEMKKSRGEREIFARNAKSTAASAKVAPNKSLPMLAACK